jgi:hypothetical protein
MKFLKYALLIILIGYLFYQNTQLGKKIFFLEQDIELLEYKIEKINN